MKTCPQCGTTYADHVEVCPSDNQALLQSVAGPDPMLGRLIAGRFFIEQKIGEGGMGTVYKALHTKMDRICAIKLLHVSHSSDESAVVRFNREAKMASRIDNPHAVTIFDFGEAEDGLLYLAMEYIEGRTLKAFLASELPLEASRAINITRQIASALSSAHSMGIVHRDLKPDNIMITRKAAERDYVKVLDFGIAKTFADIGGDSLTDTGFVLGTPLYMSPEQVSGQKVGERSDVYSLALIVYQMLSGRLPFEGDNPQAVMIKRVTTDPIPLDSVVPDLTGVVAQAVMNGLARDPGGRTRSVEDFAFQLTTAHLPTKPIGRKHTGRAIDAQTTLVAKEHPPASGFVTHAVSSGERAESKVGGSGSWIEERVAAQAWLFSKFNWKQYTGAIAVIVVAIALSVQVLHYNTRVAPAVLESSPVQIPESPSRTSDVQGLPASPPPSRAAELGNRVRKPMAPFARPRTEPDRRAARRGEALRLIEDEPGSTKEAQTVPPPNAQNTNSVAQREPETVKPDPVASDPAVPANSMKRAFGKIFGKGQKNQNQNRNEKP